MSAEVSTKKVRHLPSHPRGRASPHQGTGLLGFFREMTPETRDVRIVRVTDARRIR